MMKRLYLFRKISFAETGKVAVVVAALLLFLHLPQQVLAGCKSQKRCDDLSEWSCDSQYGCQWKYYTNSYSTGSVSGSYCSTVFFSGCGDLETCSDCNKKDTCYWEGSCKGSSGGKQSSNKNNDEDDELNAGNVVGILVFVAIILCCTVACVRYCIKKKDRSESPNNGVQEPIEVEGRKTLDDKIHSKPENLARTTALNFEKEEEEDLASPPASLPRHLIVATVTKETDSQKLGMVLSRNSQGNFTISKLRPSSPFLIMGFIVGMRVISINDVKITGQQMDVVLGLLEESVGDITVTAEAFPDDEDPSPPPPLASSVPINSASTEPMVTHRDVDEEALVEDRLDIEHGSYIAETSPVEADRPERRHYDEKMALSSSSRRRQRGQDDNPLPQPSLRSSVNDDDDDKGNNSAGFQLNTADPGTAIRVFATKQNRNQKLGVSMKRAPAPHDGGAVFVVTGIAPESPFRNTALKVGMAVLSINGINISGEEMEFVMILLESSVGEVVLVAAKATEEKEQQVEWF